MDYKIWFCLKLLRKFNLVFVVRFYGKIIFYVLYVLVLCGRCCLVLLCKMLFFYYRVLCDMIKYSSEGGFLSFFKVYKIKKN